MTLLGEDVPVLRKQPVVRVLVVRLLVVRLEKMVFDLVRVSADPPETMSVAPGEDDLSVLPRGTALCLEQVPIIGSGRKRAASGGQTESRCTKRAIAQREPSHKSDDIEP
jgi:hypothetical protein